MYWRRMLWIGAIVAFGLIISLYILLSTYDYNSLKPQIDRAVRDATGRDLTLGGKISLRFGLSPALVVENLVFQNAPWGSRPGMISAKSLEIEVALLPLIFRRIEIKRFVLIEPDVMIEIDKSGRSNLSFESTGALDSGAGKSDRSAEGRWRLPALTVAEMKIEHGRLTYKDARRGEEYHVNIGTLTMSAKGADSPVHLDLKGSYKEEAFEVTGTLGSWSRLTSGKDFPINLVATAGGNRLAVDGTIKEVADLRGIDVRLEAKAEDLTKFNSFVSQPLPLNVPFEFTARLTDPAAKSYRVSELKMVLGDSDLNGSGEVDLSGKRPVITATLLSNKLDLRPFLLEHRRKGGKAGKLFSDTPVPLWALEKADAKIKFQWSKILLPEAAINAFKADVGLKDGHLVVNPLEATLGGGTLNGSIDLEPQGTSATMNMELNAKQLDVGRMMKELGKEQAVQGHLEISMNIHGKGRSEADLMSGLNGRVVLVMRNGQIHNRYIELLGDDLSSGVFRLLNPFQKETEYTVVHCLVSGFNIRNGLAKTSAFVVDTTSMSVIGDGEVNLKTEALDLSMKPVPKGGIGTGLTGKVSLSLSELTRPFKLSGTLAHPTLGIDTARAAETIAKVVGGIALFGPAGLAATLVQGGSGEGDLCQVALEAAEKGVPLSAVEKPGVFGLAERGIEGIGKVGKKIEELFGK